MLNPQSFVPLYVQIATLLIQRITSNELSPGEQLPSERELAEAHKVSRLTARQALEELVSQGIAYRVRGRGTFVAEPKIREVTGLRSFSYDMRRLGLVPSSRVLLFEVIEPDEAIREKLKLDTNGLATQLDRLRLADGAPVAFESVLLPHAICLGIENEDMESQSLYSILQDQYGIYPAWTESEIEARGALPTEATLFEVDAGHPVMVATRITYTETFDPVEFAKSVYRGDRFTFYVGRQRIPPPSSEEG